MVTISPAWRIMLFVALPDSTSSSRLMVIVLLRGGGSLGAGGASEEVVEAGPVTTVLGAEEMFEAEPAPDRGSSRAAPAGVDSFGVVVGAESSGPIVGGSDESAGGSCD